MVAGPLFIGAAWATGVRIAFPWDLILWPESPFLTNMLKLEAGQRIFTPAADANGFVYPPGLEYLCFTALEPFRAHLDARFSRAIVAGMGAAAAALCAIAGLMLFRQASGCRAPAPLAALTFASAFLLVFGKFTADAIHPDNLHLIHVSALLLLVWIALIRKSFAAALAASALSGLGVWIKQTDAFVFAGVAAALAIFGEWGRARSFVLVAAAAAVSAFAAWLLFRSPEARFYLIEVLSRHPRDYGKLWLYLRSDLWRSPVEIALFFMALAAIPGAVRLIKGENRKLIGSWALITFAGAAPSVAGFVKLWGWTNNFRIIEALVFVLAWPILWMEVLTPDSRSEDSRSDDRKTDFGGKWKAWAPAIFPAIILAFVISARPTRVPPGEAERAYCRAVEAEVSKAVASGNRVLVDHGTSYLIRAGQTGVPLDRANTLLELGPAGFADSAGTLGRLDSGYYGRLFLTDYGAGWWYPPAIKAAIEQRYRRVTTIPSPGTREKHLEDFYFLGEVEIWEPIPGQDAAVNPR